MPCPMVHWCTITPSVHVDLEQKLLHLAIYITIDRAGFYLGTCFLGGKMVKGKYALGRGLGPFPPGKC